MSLNLKAFRGLTVAAMHLALALPLVACDARRPEIPVVPDTSTHEQNGEEPEIGGVKAAEFYRKLNYRKDTGDAPYRYLDSGWVDAVSNSPYYMRISLFLNGDNDYRLVYVEAKCKDNDCTDDKNREVAFSKVYSGQYKIREDGAMILGEIGTGEGTASHMGRPAVKIRFKSDLHTEGLAGYVDFLSYTYSNEPLEKLARDLIDSDDFKWFAGKWKRKNPPEDRKYQEAERIEFRQGPQRFVRRERFHDVGAIAGSTASAGTICHYVISSNEEVEGAVQTWSNPKYYTVSYTIKRLDLVNDDKNSPDCKDWIAKEQDSLTSNHKQDSFQFFASDKDIRMAQGGDLFERD